MSEGNSTAMQKIEAPTGALDITDQSSLTKMSMRDLRELAEIMVQSGAFTDIKSLAQAQVKIIAGAELGFSPIVSMAGIHFIQGKVELSAPLKASLIKDSRKYDYKITDHTDQRCEIAFFQKRGDEWVSCGVPVIYTTAEAKTAGLLSNKVWEKYPKDMLFNACVRQGTRRYCADLLRGFTGQGIDTDETAAIDAQAIEDTKAENVTIDAEIIETESGDTVDTATGEVVKEAAPAEPVAEIDEERAAIQEEAAAPVEAAEVNLIDLRTAAAEAYSSCKGEAKARANTWLGDKTIGKLDEAGLKAFLEAFPGM